MTTDDLVINKLNSQAVENGSSHISEAEYTQMAKDLGLDKPNFYFTITPKAFPKELYTIVKKDEKTAAENLIMQYGNWAEIFFFQDKLKKTIQKCDTSLGLVNNLRQLQIQYDDAQIMYLLSELVKKSNNTAFQNDVEQLKSSYETVKNKANRLSLYIPQVYWYGLDNQYHHWITNFLKGNFGTANNGQNIMESIKSPLTITIFLSLCTILISYLIGIPLGIYLAKTENTKFGEWLSSSIFAVYSLPTFWVAMLAIRYLTTPEFGVKIFKHAGLSDYDPSVSTITFLLNNIPFFILPILCLIIHPTAYIARLTQGAIADNLTLDYVRTAKAKGLKQNAILYKHVLKNALFPLITVLGQMLPVLITGSFIIEYIFNIHGMGIMTLEALSARDWQVVYTVFMFSTLLILIGNLLSDVLYKWVNPRVVLS